MTRKPAQAKTGAPARPGRFVKPATSALTQTRSQRSGDQVVTAASGGAAGSSEVWQARIGQELAEQLRADAQVLGLDGRTAIVKAALELLHRHAAEERMAQSVAEFYGESQPPLPLGVVPADAGS